jgi:uroporphyrinogen decarboxylase
VFNLGHGVLPPTPPEHVAQLVETVRRADRKDAA